MSSKTTVPEHMRHMTDGHWHDDCSYCLTRRVTGGTGVPEVGALRRNGIQWEVFDGLDWQITPPPPPGVWQS